MATKKEKVEFNASVHSKKLEQAIKEASDVKIQIESGNEAIKDIREMVKETMGLAPSEFNALLKIYHTQSREQVEEANQELLGVYDAIFTN